MVAPTLDDTAFTLSMRLRGSFVVTPVSMRALEVILKNFVGILDKEPIANNLCVVFPATQSQTCPCVEQALALRNARACPIEAIIFTFDRNARKVLLRLDSRGIDDMAAIVVNAHAESSEVIAALRKDLQAEACNMRTWFSFARCLLDSVFIPLKRWPATSLVMLVLIFVLLYMLYDYCVDVQQPYLDRFDAAKKDWETRMRMDDWSPESDAAESVARAEMMMAYQMLLHQSATLATKSTILAVGYTFLCAAIWIGLRGGTLLFPRVEFAIGEGVQRVERSRAIRNLLLMTMGMSGLLLPLLRRWLWGGG